jgi:hypothetical protein
LFCGGLELQRLNDNVQGDEDLLKLLEDLQDAIFLYQVCSRRGVHSDINKENRWHDKQGS